MDGIGVAHECFHSIKVNILKAMVLKLYLVEAYNHVNWDYLILVLLHIGLILEATNWVMPCVVSTNFIVLVNGSSTKFFQSSRGIMQGCPLSTLLFLLIIEGISILIEKEKVEGILIGVKIYSFIRIIHLVFVDDVLLLGEGTLENMQSLSQILNLYKQATGMEINRKIKSRIQ